MDFERILEALLRLFEEEKIRYGVIGGFALGLLGVPRATMDLDFLVHRDDLGRLHQRLTGLGYHREAALENVSHYVHPTSPGGAIDIIHAFRPYALEMLERVQTASLQSLHTIRVLQPEDIIGFKVQALANNPLRRVKETLDIEALAGRYGSALDWNRIQRYYDLFDLGQEAAALRARYEHPR